MNKRESFLRMTRKRALFLVVLVFAWLNFSNANNNDLNIFQDRDQDGLSDSEEMAYGTDPDNDDSDGDGYSDGAEVRSGYDPTKPAPGDKIVIETAAQDEQPAVAGQSDTKEQKENLTDIFIKKIEQEKGSELDVLQQFSQNPEEFASSEEFEKLSEVSLTKQDIETVLQDSLSGQLGQDQLEMLDEGEITVLDKPTAKNEEEVKEKEGEQIEQYFTAVGYVFLSHSPIEIENENELETKAIDLVNQLTGYMQQGNIAELEKFKQDGQEMFNEIKEVPVPEALKDFHLTGLSVLNYILKIDPDDLINSNDPINQIIVIGKIQAALSELESMQSEVMNILDEYGIKAFSPEGYQEDSDNNSDGSATGSEDKQETNEETTNN